MSEKGQVLIMLRELRHPPDVAAKVKASTWPQQLMINLNDWTEEEHKQLFAMSIQSRIKDFHSIAVAMNTGRTSYQCYLHLKTQTLLGDEQGKEWSYQETDILESLVKTFASKPCIPWGRVAASMENRSKSQCYAKYCLINEAKRMGDYLWEEDAVIISFVNNFGHRFRDLANILVGRSPAQLAARFQKILQLHALGSWSLHEDIQLILVMQSWPVPEGQNFSDYADIAAKTNIASFNNKTVDDIKERFRAMKAWTMNNPFADVTFALHRFTWARIKPNPEFTKDLALALKCLKDRLVIELKSYQEAHIKKRATSTGLQAQGLKGQGQVPLAE